MSSKRLIEPESAEELLRGWLLHCHKARDRHDEAAREYDAWRYRLGIPTVVLGAVVGTAVFASLGESQRIELTILVGLISVGATILAAVQTFLDFAGRAERHRVAGVRYKTIIWELEQSLTDDLPAKDRDAAWFDDLRQRMAALEEAAPVVTRRIWERVNKQYGDAEFVTTAMALYGLQPPVAAPAAVTPAVQEEGAAAGVAPSTNGPTSGPSGDQTRTARRARARAAAGNPGRTPD